MNSKKSKPRNIIFKMLRTKNKRKKIFKGAKEKQEMTADFLSETRETKRKKNGTFEVLKENNRQP